MPSTSRPRKDPLHNLLFDVTGWALVRKKTIAKRHHCFLKLNGSVLTAHSNPKAPIHWAYCVQQCSVSASFRRGTLTITLQTGLTLHILLDSRPDCRLWVRKLERASGRCFDHFYRIAEKIGEGAFASVYKAVCLRDGGVVAVKVIKKKQFDMQMERELGREMYAMKRVSHEFIINSLDVFNLVDRVYIVLDYMQGGTLKDNVQLVGGTVPELYTVRIVRQVLEACDYMHSRGIIHRDIKLENILCSTRGISGNEIKLADFGYVNFVNDIRDLCLRSLVGTPVYVAPEVINQLEYGSPVDIYAVGVMLYRMISGCYPYDAGADDEKTMKLTVGANLTFSEPEWQTVSPSCKSLVRSLLQPVPNRRLTAKGALQHVWLLQHENLMSTPKHLPDEFVAMSPVTPSDSTTAAYSLKKRISETINRLAAHFSADSELDEMERVSVSDFTDEIRYDGMGGALSERQMRIRKMWRRAIFTALFIRKLELLAGTSVKGSKRRFDTYSTRKISVRDRVLPDRQRGIVNVFARFSTRERRSAQSTRMSGRRQSGNMRDRLRRTLSLANV